MKKIFISILVLGLYVSAGAQDYLGLVTGNYAGINGIGLQPASVADSRYRFDFNLASTDFGFQNNYLGFTRNYFIQERFSFKDFKSFQDFRDRVLTENKLGVNEKGYFNLQNTVLLPGSFMITGKKGGLALTIQNRTGFSMTNVNGNLMSQIYNVWGENSTYNQVYNNDGLEMNALNWYELGLTYGRILLNKNKHFLKFGATGRQIGGLSSMYMSADKLSVTALNKDSMAIAATNLAYGHSATNISGRINSSFRPDATSFGGSFGLVYEFRGRVKKFQFLRKQEGSDSPKLTLRRDRNKYTFKIGASLLDVGALTFKSVLPGSRIDYNGILNVSNLGVKNVAGFDSLIAKNATYSGDTASKYTMALPTALSLQFDLHLLSGFYINAMTYQPFTALNKDAKFRMYTPNFYTVTPRFETRAFGLYVPLSSTSIKSGIKDRDFTIGTTLRLGPLFVGTANIATLIKRDNIRSADVHAGLKLPIAYGKPSKASRWIKNVIKEESDGTADRLGILPSLPGVDIDALSALDSTSATNSAEIARLRARIADLQRRNDELEAELEISNARKAVDAAAAVEAEAEVIADDDDNDDDDDDDDDRDSRRSSDDDDYGYSRTSRSRKNSDNKPVQITINNYGGDRTSTSVTGGDDNTSLESLNDQIEYLRYKLQQKERLIKLLQEQQQAAPDGSLQKKK